jgi:hypothetical protein
MRSLILATSLAAAMATPAYASTVVLDFEALQTRNNAEKIEFNGQTINLKHPADEISISWDLHGDFLTGIFSDPVDHSSLDNSALKMTGEITDSLGRYLDAPASFAASLEDVGNFDLATIEVTSSPFVAAPVPEASTWAMLAIGFAGLFYAAKRQRNGATATA